MQYDRLLLNNLMDSYEKSLLSSGKNKVQIRIAMTFSKRNLLEYFDESSMVYEEIHVAANELEKRGFLTIQWKNRKTGTIIEKIILNAEKVDEIYQYLGRTPKADDEKLTREILEEYLTKSCSPNVFQQRSGSKKSVQQFAGNVNCSAYFDDDFPKDRTGITENFVHYLLQRLDLGKSVKEYIDISDQAETRDLLRVLKAIEGNQKESYIREFSIEHLGDSKKLENMLGLIGKIMRRFGSGYEDMGTEEILAEYQIYHTPNYVYFKGDCCLIKNAWDIEKKTIQIEAGLEEDNLESCAAVETELEKKRLSDNKLYINLSALQQGIGISGEDIESLCLSETSHIKQVITIENLTTFYRWNEPGSILIYLGGYHDQVRRNLLQMIYQQLPNAKYLHFGDIDVGGFEIYLDLCRKTGIPFQLYHMGIQELKKYAKYGRKLTENDNRRLDKLLEKIERRTVEKMPDKAIGKTAEKMPNKVIEKTFGEISAQIQENPADSSCQEIAGVLKYMKITQLKLEQECMNLRDFID